MGGKLKEFLDSPKSYYVMMGSAAPFVPIIVYTANQQGWGMYGLACAVVLLIGICFLWICTIPTRIRRKTVAQYVAEQRGKKRS
jgi:di/tricarboxylate transporter